MIVVSSECGFEEQRGDAVSGWTPVQHRPLVSEFKSKWFGCWRSLRFRFVGGESGGLGDWHSPQYCCCHLRVPPVIHPNPISLILINTTKWAQATLDRWTLPVRRFAWFPHTVVLLMLRILWRETTGVTVSMRFVCALMRPASATTARCLPRKQSDRRGPSAWNGLCARGCVCVCVTDRGSAQSHRWALEYSACPTFSPMKLNKPSASSLKSVGYNFFFFLNQHLRVFGGLQVWVTSRSPVTLSCLWPSLQWNLGQAAGTFIVSLKENPPKTTTLFSKCKLRPVASILQRNITESKHKKHK